MEKRHLDEDALVKAATGELPRRKLERARAHLEICDGCQARLVEIEDAMAEIFAARRWELDSRMTPADGPRAGLQRRLEEVAAEGEMHWWFEWLLRWKSNPRPALASLGLAVALALAGLSFLARRGGNAELTRLEQALYLPDTRLTPGEAQALPLEAICSPGAEDPAPEVPRGVALEVFRLHGVRDPAPRAFELDYLIPPELGGTGAVGNLWPQPYQAERWNAYAKDALEDHLHHLVCGGLLDLETAQGELADDWIAAYRKYFRAEAPLLMHASFLKDRPWE